MNSKRMIGSIEIALNIFLTVAMLALPAGMGIAQEKSGYRIGDRLPANAATKPSPFRSVTWEELIPADWDPMKGFKDLNLQEMSDADPRAIKALEELRAWWDKAPVRQDMNKAMVRIAGFVIPLERQKDTMTEFLLVPYFGACIHTPPPPANQMIHAIAARPVAGIRSMEPAWITGEIETVRSDTSYGAASYRLRVNSVEPYKAR